jgi:hypothetical protein
MRESQYSKVAGGVFEEFTVKIRSTALTFTKDNTRTKATKDLQRHSRLMQEQCKSKDDLLVPSHVDMGWRLLEDFIGDNVHTSQVVETPSLRRLLVTYPCHV